MKYRNGIVIVYILIMLGALAGLWFTTGGKTAPKRDMVAYNDELHRIGKAYLEGQARQSIEEQFSCKLVLAGEPEAEVMRAYSEYGLVMDFAPEDEVIGKVIWHDVGGDFQGSRNTFRRTFLIFWAVVFVGGLLFLMAIDWFLLRPTREMRGFAGEIAKGNLDVPLPIRKHNPFGNLVEGFDLMREELKASRMREAEAEKAKKELVAELAHDIKTPVATIRATCEVMELRQRRLIERLSVESAAAEAAAAEAAGNATAVVGGLKPTEAAGAAGNAWAIAEAKDVLGKAQTIAHKTETIQQLMDNVFQTTLEELDRIEVNRAEESSGMVEEYFRNLRNYGNIILENSIPPCLVYMDRLRMEQVIDNVVGNSHKYAGTDIHVRFDEIAMKAADSEEAKFLRIRVHDDGPGAPEDELPMLMEKYYRGNAAKGKTGFGLGLYLVRSYMEKQGGGVEVYNDCGFTVDLYLRKV
ncbi:MAG: HAMP domain-containing histidine kinase [Lachnospiraceae bacterium]|nr:HAMP domain-containing histidine kinase [Lachnospiraceae bacterium]